MPTHTAPNPVRRRNHTGDSVRQSPLLRQWRPLEQLLFHRQGMTINELAYASGVSAKTAGRDLALFKRLGVDVAETGNGYRRKRWRVCHPSEAARDGLQRYGLIRDSLRGLRKQAESLGDPLVAADLEALVWRVAKECEEKKPKPR